MLSLQDILPSAYNQFLALLSRHTVCLQSRADLGGDDCDALIFHDKDDDDEEGCT